MNWSYRYSSPRQPREAENVGPVDVETLSTADTVLFFISLIAIFLMLAIPFTLLFSVAIIDEILSNRFGSLD